MTSERAPRFSLIVLGSQAVGVGPPALLTGPGDEHRFETIECPGTDADARRAALSRARGDFVGFVDLGDRLHPDAGTELSLATDAPDVDVVYTDEDVVDGDGIHHDPFLKPGWSPERVLAQGYLGRLTLYRRPLAVTAASECRSSGPAFEHELVLRISEATRNIAHVDRVLYHRVAGRVDASCTAGIETVNEHLERRGAPLRAEPSEIPGIHRIVPNLAHAPLVSIVIPTRGTERRVRGESIVLVANCIESIFERSTYSNVEIVCVADTLTPAATLQTLRALDDRRVRIVEFDRAFNFSEKINVGVEQAAGDYLLLLNDDTEVVSPGWIETLLAFAADPGVGAVGGRLRFEDGRLQHVGVILCDGGAGHPYYGYPSTTAGYFGTPHVVANYLAVTAACLMTRRECFEQVGGFSPRFPVNYNDVDFCLKLHEHGYRIVYTPGATLDHYESSSRGMRPVAPEELELLQGRWGAELHADPYYSRRFLPGGNFLTEVRLDGRAVDEPPISYRGVIRRRIRDAARRAKSRS